METLVSDAVKFINEKANETLYKGSIEIGSYVLEKFFYGDIDPATSRNPKKITSFRALCRNKDLAVRPEALGMMVRVAAQERLFAQKNLPVEQLSYSHKAELVVIF